MRGAAALLVFPLINLAFVLFSWSCLPHDPSLQSPEVAIKLLGVNLTVLAIPFDEEATTWGSTSNLAV